MSFNTKSSHFLFYNLNESFYRLLFVLFFGFLSESVSGHQASYSFEVRGDHLPLYESVSRHINLSDFISNDKIDESVWVNYSNASALPYNLLKVDFEQYMVLFLFLLFLLFLLRRYEINRLRIKNQLEVDRVELESLRKLNDLRSHFFTNISHEFRIPLTLICGNIETLLSSEISDFERERLESARRNAGQLLILINQLLDLSKLEEGKMQLQLCCFDIVSLAHSVLQCFLPQAESRTIRLIFEPEKEDIPVKMDMEKMESMLNNLLSNALKYTDDGGVVRLLICALDDRILEIRVEDNGQGIPDNELTAIFNRFYQSEKSHARNVTGTGIGLAHTRELAVLHGGSITAHSVKDEYTAFVLRLPVITSEPITEGCMEPANTQIGMSSLKAPCSKVSDNEDLSENSVKKQPGEIILIVEDNAEVSRFLRQQLEADYLVYEAADGLKGLEIAREILPDLIVSDVMMPGMDGFRFCNEIRNNQLTSHIPLILLTAKSGLEEKLEGFENGIDDFITKPFSTREIKARIRNLLNIRRLLRERFEKNGYAFSGDSLAVPADKAFLDKAIKIINDHIEDSGYKVESLADDLSISVSQLNRKLNALINLPAGELIRSFKLKRAAEMLKNKTGSVSEICYTLGFNDHAYFTRSFKKHFGCSPTEFMKSTNSDLKN